MWMIENPGRGLCVPDDLPHEYILGISKPYLGNFISLASDWTPLKHYTNAFSGYTSRTRPSDPWQFKNFLIRKATPFELHRRVWLIFRSLAAGVATEAYTEKRA